MKLSEYSPDGALIFQCNDVMPRGGVSLRRDDLEVLAQVGNESLKLFGHPEAGQQIRFFLKNCNLSCVLIAGGETVLWSGDLLVFLAC